MPSVSPNPPEKEIALDDERRVKSLSPSMLVAKRFFRNRLAIVGLAIIILMFLFSFLGAIFSPYGESQVFKHYTVTRKDYASVRLNASYSFFFETSETELDSQAKTAFSSAVQKGEESFSANGTVYSYENHGEYFSVIRYKEIAEGTLLGGTIRVNGSVSEEEKDSFITAASEGKTEFTLGDNEYFLEKSGKRYALKIKENAALATTLIIKPLSELQADYEMTREILTAIADGTNKFEYESSLFTVLENRNVYIVMSDDEPLFRASRYSVQPMTSGTAISAELLDLIENAASYSLSEFEYGGETYHLSESDGGFIIRRDTGTQLISIYGYPSPEHWLGTDENGMDILTRLMHGGRISLMIGFVVVIIEVVLGIILGGIAGYFGGFLDGLIMRIVDVFNCIPSLPLFIIIGAIMDSMKIDPQLRIYALMLILGLLSWPSIARLVRGQILSLREQEFMLAAECMGIKPMKRIFRHLIPNVIPQLIVMATMGLGSVILTESTLSFLGLGVKFPYASWGNIINAVSNIHVMTNYLFVWIPAGILILLTVLGFNFVGDGLRDAFDPKMKR